MTADILAALTPRAHVPTLVEIVNRHPAWKIGAEIGVAQGRTSLALMRECPHITLIGVEPFRYIADAEGSGLYRDFDFAHNERCVRAVSARYIDRFIVMKMTSLEAAASTNTLLHALDFVFIDANHTYAEVRDDIAAWAAKVRSGGWIMGHDYCARWPGVVRAVDELVGKPMLFAHAIWAVAKP